jgi:hypothetical protein
MFGRLAPSLLLLFVLLSWLWLLGVVVIAIGVFFMVVVT